MQMLRSLHPPDALCALSVTKFCLTGREFMRGGWLALPSLVNAGNVVTRIKLSLRLLLSLTRSPCKYFTFHCFKLRRPLHTSACTQWCFSTCVMCNYTRAEWKKRAHIPRRARGKQRWALLLLFFCLFFAPGAINLFAYIPTAYAPAPGWTRLMADDVDYFIPPHSPTSSALSTLFKYFVSVHYISTLSMSNDALIAFIHAPVVRLYRNAELRRIGVGVPRYKLD